MSLTTAVDSSPTKMRSVLSKVAQTNVQIDAFVSTGAVMFVGAVGGFIYFLMKMTKGHKGLNVIPDMTVTASAAPFQQTITDNPYGAMNVNQFGITNISQFGTVKSNQPGMANTNQFGTE